MFRLFDPGLGPTIAAILVDGADTASIAEAVRRVGPVVEAVILVGETRPEDARHPFVAAGPERSARLAAALAGATRLHGKVRGVVLVDPAMTSHDWRAIEALKARPADAPAEGPEGLVLWPSSAPVAETTP
jgi:hypothetical protein